MIFKNEKEIFDFYKKYAYHAGFPVRKRNSKKDDKVVATYVVFTCSRDVRRAVNTSTSLNLNQPGKLVVRLNSQHVHLLMEYGKSSASINTITKLVHLIQSVSMLS